MPHRHTVPTMRQVIPNPPQESSQFLITTPQKHSRHSSPANRKQHDEAVQKTDFESSGIRSQRRALLQNPSRYARPITSTDSLCILCIICRQLKYADEQPYNHQSLRTFNYDIEAYEFQDIAGIQGSCLD
jgi:hypothetical protein